MEFQDGNRGIFKEALELAGRHDLKKREHRALYGMASAWKGIDEQEFQTCMTRIHEIQGHLRETEGVFFDEVD
ncbi:hypothetical protein ACFQ49_06445 [Kroppenstedtia eburnea]|uniref:hypothetical protein n=1 Tax=Kroppenstedtia eburnea TaxID=714067 RepID=UPI003635D418